MKKLIIGLIVGVMVSATVPAFAKMIFDNSNVKNVSDTWMILDEGKEMNMDDPSSEQDYLILNYNNRTYVPLRLVAENLGYDSESMWLNEYPKIIFLNKEQDHDRNYNLAKFEADYFKSLEWELPHQTGTYRGVQAMDFNIINDVLHVDVYTFSTGPIDEVTIARDINLQLENKDYNLGFDTMRINKREIENN